MMRRGSSLYIVFVVIMIMFQHESLELVEALLPTNLVKAKAKPMLDKQPKIIPNPEAYLSTSYYHKSCPKLEGIIHQKVRAWFLKDNTLPASIIRLHFHDCAVRGCDGSILLNHAGSERRAEGSKTLRGFQVINEIKAEVEKVCPKTVSCADILTAAARDATLLVGGPFWEVPFGRRDGRVSMAKEADMVPQGHENVTSLIDFFGARLGLNVLDLVVLSGSHTIGRTACHSIQHRLMSAATIPVDPKYLSSLKQQCRSTSTKTKTNTKLIHLDPTTPTNFDPVYYNNLQQRKGTLSTDQVLYSDPRTLPLVAAFASQPSLFIDQFAVSMVKLGNVQYITNKSRGEIRLHSCDYVN